MKCFSPLAGKAESIIPDIKKIPRLQKPFPMFSIGCDPVTFLSSKAYTKLSMLGKLYSIVFEMMPFADKRNIHIDLDHDTEDPFWPALNIIISGQGLMRWFSPIGPGQLAQHNIGVKYRYWTKPYYGDIIDEWGTGKISLVRTDIPHQAFNFDNENRCVISVRWSTKMSWEETIDWFDKEWNNML